MCCGESDGFVACARGWIGWLLLCCSKGVYLRRSALFFMQSTTIIAAEQRAFDGTTVNRCREAFVSSSSDGTWGMHYQKRSSTIEIYC